MADRAPSRPRLALTLGDPAGIGPEVALAALDDARVRAAARVVVLGPGRFRPAHVPLGNVDDFDAHELAWIDTGGPETFEVGRVQASCGRAALDALRCGVELARARRVDGLVTAPVSKEALHAAGEKVEGQTELLGRWDGAQRFQMMAIAGRLRVMLLSRHLPLRAALDLVTVERVLEHLVLLDETLRGWGFAEPRLALAGFNPHAGERGVLGCEDLEVLEPAVAAARARGLCVKGPLSPDTVFIAAGEGQHDAVLALYHDQAFIPIKLAARHTALTVIAGLSFLRVSPAHGTAFDIAGRGLASPRNMIVALLQAAAWSAGKPLAIVEDERALEAAIRGDLPRP
ncbi:MAG: 4-hydroxythreonine-4-phosphate dehydrogenase PdxA [Planctomycetes bacterium]|nr:4-hydroxythreonine-4-phosphate dehydrogenase PdxA [Planctomycetota bacterium]